MNEFFVSIRRLKEKYNIALLEHILPDSLFGHRMPWASDDSKTTIKTPDSSESDPDTIDPLSAPHDSSKEEEPSSSEISDTADIPFEASTSIQDGLSKLKLELFTNIETRATSLHEKAKAVHAKIVAIDDLLTLIEEWSTSHPNEPVNCQDPKIKQATEVLRQQGIRVPLPEKKLETNQIGNFFTTLGNQRSALEDEFKEYTTEFQQCTVERNTLLQHLSSMVSGLSRVTNKIATNFSTRSH